MSRISLWIYILWLSALLGNEEKKEVIYMGKNFSNSFSFSHDKFDFDFFDDYFSDSDVDDYNDEVLSWVSNFLSVNWISLKDFYFFLLSRVSDFSSLSGFVSSSDLLSSNFFNSDDLLFLLSLLSNDADIEFNFGVFSFLSSFSSSFDPYLHLFSFSLLPYSRILVCPQCGNFLGFLSSDGSRFFFSDFVLDCPFCSPFPFS